MTSCSASVSYTHLDVYKRQAQNTSFESYAKAHNIKLQLKALNILCIGNSHTDDYTTYMQSILNDVNGICPVVPWQGGGYVLFPHH